jgi:hypothetical protein
MSIFRDITSTTRLQFQKVLACGKRDASSGGPDGGFITGSDFLMDGRVTAAYWYDDLAEVRGQ